MAIYPDDATVSATAFSQTGVVSYASTGFDSTFELAANIDFVAESIVTMNKTTMIPLAVGLGIYADIEAATALNANTLKIELLRLCGKVDSITIDDKTMPPTVKVNHFIKQSFAEPAQVPQA